MNSNFWHCFTFLTIQTMNFWLLIEFSFVDKTEVKPCLTTHLVSPKTTTVLRALYDSATVRMVLLGLAVNWSC